MSYRTPRLSSTQIAAILSMAAIFCPPLFSATDLQILTFPIGLITGEHRIEVDLGVTQEPADLYLDGKKVCTPTASEPWCTVDFGPAPHVHLLDLVRRGPDGGVAQYHERWFNRPGQEAELAIMVSAPSANGACSGQLVWLHPEKLDPTGIEVTEDGRALKLLDDRGSFRFPCRSPDSNQLISASAVFPDGRRAEAVAVASGFGDEARVDMTAVALSLDTLETEERGSTPSGLGETVTLVEKAGAEVVFVLDPEADYRSLLNSPGARVRIGNAWRKTESSLFNLSKLWFVMPDVRLRRVDGFSQVPRRVHEAFRPSGKEGWLRTLFAVATTPTEGDLRLADAVAASGLVAASGPRKRAVVLILGNGQGEDNSLFTPALARAYLSEVGVPLFVLRTGKVRDDGWPAGVRITTMYALANELDEIRDQVLDQQVVWFRGARTMAGIAADLPNGIEVAGWSGRHEELVEHRWNEVWAEEVLIQEETSPPTESFGERIEVSAVRLLVSARDSEGKPITDLTMGELTVTEDGQEVAVIGLEPVRSQTVAANAAAVEADIPTPVEPTAKGVLPVTVYVETGLTGSMDTAPTLAALARRADSLTRLGPVDLVVAGPDGVRTVEEGLTDEEQLRTALEGLSSLPYSLNAIERIRVEYMRDLKTFSSDMTAKQGEMPNGAQIVAAEMLARRAIAEEERVIQQPLDRMNDWAAVKEGWEPRVLIAVGTGFDEQPGEFYFRKIFLLDKAFAASRAAQLLETNFGESTSRLGRELAAAGFAVYPVATRISAKHSRAAEFSGAEIVQSFNQNSGELGVDFLLLDPVGSQRHLAQAGGGRVIGSGKSLEKLVDESSGWYVLTYQVDRVLDGRFREIRVAGDRPGIRIDHTLVTRAGTSEGRSASRLRHLLAGRDEFGELAIEMSVGAVSTDEDDTVTAEVAVTIPVAKVIEIFGQTEARELRISIAIENEPGSTTIRHDTEFLTASQSGLHYTFPAQYTGSAARLAVTAEDLGSGIWGGVVQELPQP